MSLFSLILVMAVKTTQALLDRSEMYPGTLASELGVVEGILTKVHSWSPTHHLKKKLPEVCLLTPETETV